MSRCMVLNASYEYLNVEQNWFRSLMLVLEGKADPIEHYSDVVRSEHCTFNLPAVSARWPALASAPLRPTDFAVRLSYALGTSNVLCSRITCARPLK